MKKTYIAFGLTVLLVTAAATSCKKIIPSSPVSDMQLSGTIDDLTPAQNEQHLRGDVAFGQVYTAETGLGPIFVSNSCVSCHAGDGKGHPFTTLTRFGQIDSTGNHFMAHGGPQLQNLSLPGFKPEEIPAGARASKFTPPANTGLGFLDAVSDSQILALADPHDADGDGISGVPNWVTLKSYVQPRPNAISNGGKYIARYGKKGSTYSLLQQVSQAFDQDMGITSDFESADDLTGQSVGAEVSAQSVMDVVFYLQTLKAPIQRNCNDADVIAGKQLFVNVGCAKCHTPDLKTGYSDLPALAYKTIHPYTDLLLHDMGSALDDGYTEGSALTSEWKTPPLWGCGLSPASQGRSYYLMHDGRAHSIEEAINDHGGEGTKARNNFSALSNSDQQKLLKFIESL